MSSTDTEEQELISRAMQVLGRRKSPAKTAAVRANGKLGGRPRGTLKPLDEVKCRCGRGGALEGHPTTCPRGRAIRRRRAAGQPLEGTATTHEAVVPVPPVAPVEVEEGWAEWRRCRAASETAKGTNP